MGGDKNKELVISRTVEGKNNIEIIKPYNKNSQNIPDGLKKEGVYLNEGRLIDTIPSRKKIYFGDIPEKEYELLKSSFGRKISNLLGITKTEDTNAE